MDWEEAIKQSPKGTCTRTKVGANGIKTDTIRYPDGSGYCLVSQNGKVDFFLSHVAGKIDLNGYDDWEPSTDR